MIHCVIAFLMQCKSQVVSDGRADVFLLEGDVALTAIGEIVGEILTKG